MRIKHISFIAILLISTMIPTMAGDHAIDLKLKELDRCLENADLYQQRKEKVISNLRDELRRRRNESIDTVYWLNYRLFEEYQSHQYDSAWVYADRCAKIGERMNDRNLTVRGECAKVFCYLSSGLFKEAFDALEEIDLKGVGNAERVLYYGMYHRLYYDYSDYVSNPELYRKYTAAGTAYADSLMSYAQKDSYEWYNAKALCEIKHQKYGTCISIYRKMLRDFRTNDHEKAIIYSCIGGAYYELVQKDSAIFYLATSAIYDILSATKETTSLCRVAELMNERKDSERAYKYINATLKDAEFYNARQRKLSINPVLPIIEQERYDTVRVQRNQSYWFLGVCVVLLAVIVVAGVVLMRQNKTLKRKRIQLTEANRIKEEYIGNSFYVNSEFISEMEELFKTIQQKTAARQYEDLKDISKLSVINKKRENMYASFDECFLNIFPTFISEYAKLFPEGEINPEAKSLTPEMRIFALIRLGITDSERIAKFLNYSVHTIYTYKTRVKNRSIVSNDEFEARIKGVEMVILH
ncbi:MAG: DUF6377 domain-containing protein [Candidatus Cryptobacteroides sp.]